MRLLSRINPGARFRDQAMPADPGIQSSPEIGPVMDRRPPPSPPAAAAPDARPVRRLSRILVLLCLLLPAAVYIVKTLNDRTAAIALAERDVETTLRIFEQHALKTLQTYQLVAHLVDEHLRGRDWRELDESEHLHTYVTDLVRDYPQIRAISVIDRDGVLRLSSFPPGIVAPNFADRDYFRILRAHDEGTVIGQRIHSWLSGENIMSVARRRTTAVGGFDGVVAVTALPDAVTSFWAQGPPAGETAIYRRDGRLLARYPRPDGDMSQMRAGLELVEAVNTADRGAYSAISPIDGKERFMAFRKIAGFPIFIVHAVAMDDTIRLWRDSAIRDGAFSVIAALGLVVLALNLTRHARRGEAALAALVTRSNQLRVEVRHRATVEANLARVLRDTVDRQEADRKRVARDLHDSLGQHAAMLHFGLDRIGRDADDADRVREQVKQLKTTATEVSHAIGRIAWELRPVGLDELGLLAAIQTYVESIAVNRGLMFDLHITLGERRLDPGIETALYRIVQEGLTNVVRHAEAARVGIVLDANPHEVWLIIEDDGKGFRWRDCDAPSPDGGGFGLMGMRERVLLLGGTLEIETAPGKGTALLVHVPI